jgi:hypothetical protein
MRGGHGLRAETGTSVQGGHRHDAFGPSSGSALPKIIGVLVAIGVLRAVLGNVRRHAGTSDWHERRHEAIAKLHRELHREDAERAAADPA